MRYLTGAVRVGIVAAHQFQRVFESLDVHKTHVEGKENRTDHQPKHDHGKLRPEQWDFKEDETANRFGNRCGCLINCFVKASMRGQSEEKESEDR